MFKCKACRSIDAREFLEICADLQNALSQRKMCTVSPFEKGGFVIKYTKNETIIRFRKMEIYEHLEHKEYMERCELRGRQVEWDSDPKKVLIPEHCVITLESLDTDWLRSDIRKIQNVLLKHTFSIHRV
jgi:hypothetical protein